MKQISIRQTGKKAKISKKNQVKICSGVRIPKTFLLLYHNQESEKLVIKHQSLVTDLDCSYPNNLVTAVNISNFSIYFSFLPEEEQIEAYTQLISLIAKTGRSALTEFSSTTLSLAVKRAYLKTLSIYRSLSSGTFLTDMFLKKLRGLVATIWRHAQNYLSYCKTNFMGDVSGNCTVEVSTEYSF